MCRSTLAFSRSRQAIEQQREAGRTERGPKEGKAFLSGSSKSCHCIRICLVRYGRDSKIFLPFWHEPKRSLFSRVQCGFHGHFGKLSPAAPAVSIICLK